MTETTNARAAERLVAEARGAVHESLTFLAAPEADRVRALIAALETAVEGRTAIRMAAAPSAPADQTALRDRIAAAIWERQNPGCRWADCEYRWRADAEADADAVLAVLPAPADRAAGPAALREAAAFYESVLQQSLDPDSDPRYCTAVRDVVMGLRHRADEAQQPETQAARRVLTPNEHDRAWHAIEGAAGDPGADPGTVLNAVLRALRIDAPTAEDEQAASPRRKADATRQDETLPAEDPARIDRMRPEFTEHASVESIDVQLRRARAQLRRWHLRVEWLISLRQARVEQKERGEWPAAASQPGKEA
jgi:hypothetical protein